MSAQNGNGESSHILEVQDVTLSFGDFKVLDGVSFNLGREERLVVMGQSGSGKSTLLRLIMGVLKPDSGSIRFEGHEVTKLGRRQLNQLRRKMGMVYQYSALLSSLTVRDNLALPLEEWTDLSREEIDAIVDEKLELVNMLDARNKLPNELSGGMRKRAGLARALVMKPDLILYDEPSAGLDPVISSVIDQLIIDLAEKNDASSIIVTHELDSAFRVATRMAMLYEGKIIEEGAPENFKESGDPVVAQFLSGETEGPMRKDNSP